MKYNLILDSDALIKLTHSEIIFSVCNAFNCLITKEVEEEAVTEGKKRFYPDAFVIEKLIKSSLLNVRAPKSKLKIKESLGKGEISVLKLHSSVRKSIIISDDSAFIRYLENNNIIFFVPSDLIILLKKLGKISLKEAMYFLDKMKAFIKDEVYNEAKKELKEV